MKGLLKAISFAMNACRAAQATPVTNENYCPVSADKDQIINRLDRLLEVADSKDSPNGVSRAEGASALPVRDVSDQDCVGKYHLKRLLGTGAFGVVYEAYDQDLGRKVALKLPRLEVLLDQEKRARFSHEAVVAAQLDHPGIVRVYEAQLNDAEPYIASALCQGPTLAQWLVEDPNRADDWRQIVMIVAEVADAIDYAHGQGVFHRDIKPAKINDRANTNRSQYHCQRRVVDLVREIYPANQRYQYDHQQQPRCKDRLPNHGEPSRIANAFGTRQPKPNTLSPTRGFAFYWLAGNHVSQIFCQLTCRLIP